ncbi:MAG: ATP-dependent DNA helicase RecQ [Nanoarchaeota archaeon]
MIELLKKYFGYNEFRPMQLDIIDHVLKNKDSLVIMPTGGGKSICYQLPTLKLEGLTLVISPLISLMKDQVDSLRANGINAEYINSTLFPEEISLIQDKIQKKEIKLLYIAPERLALEEFKVFLSTLQISLIAIDEAHCISEWGHDFRPEYRNLKSLRILFPDAPIIALTATATERVRIDILKQLSLREPKLFISSFNRKNLNLMVVEKKKTVERIIKMLEEYADESVIIYCFSRKDSENIGERLRNHGFDALPYHAGLDNETRKKNQDMFIKDKVNIIVATIAFGMGINKPDVRLIIHHTFPKTLEGYYQEIGRAGRDGLSSDCVLFYSRGDRRKHEFFIDKIEDETTKNNARTKLNQVMNYCEDLSCRRKQILKYFGEDFLEANCGACDSCMDLSKPGKTEQKVLISKEKGKVIEYNHELFEKLRILRKKIATQRNVPPFIIFGDVSLREMASHLPSNNEEFLNIKGVGQQKLKDFGDLFLDAIKNYLKEKRDGDNGDILDYAQDENNSGTDYHERLKK